MLQNPRKTLGFKKNMVYEIPPGGGGKPYPASGLQDVIYRRLTKCHNDVFCTRATSREPFALNT